MGGKLRNKLEILEVLRVIEMLMIVRMIDRMIDIVSVIVGSVIDISQMKRRMIDFLLLPQLLLDLLGEEERRLGRQG